MSKHPTIQVAVLLTVIAFTGGGAVADGGDNPAGATTSPPKNNFYKGNPKEARKMPPFQSVDPTVPGTGPWRWWDEARLGLLWCYGMSSHPNPKSTLEERYKAFNPARFDADRLVEEAGKIGAGYIVFTSVWHDDFCLWDTKLSEFNSARARGGRDLLAELYRSCQGKNMPLLLYQGIRDKRPGSPVQMDRVEFRKAAVVECMRRFPKVHGFWFDYWPRDQKPEEIFLHAWYEKEYGRPDIFLGRAGQANTPEGPIGPFDRTARWETCREYYSGWYWDRPITIKDKAQALKQFIQPLVHCAGNDGNMLHNWAIAPDGTLDPALMQVNELIGQWMSKFGHAIRNTRGGPFHVNTARGTGGYLAPKVPEDLLRDAGPNNVQITSTCRGNTIWLHILQGAGQPLVLPPVPARILKHQSLNSGAFTVKQTDQGIEIALQEGKPDALDTILELEFDGEAFAIEPVFGLAGRGAK